LLKVVEAHDWLVKNKQKFLLLNKTSFFIIFSDNKLLHALNKCEPEVLRAMPDPTLPNTDYRTISTLSDLCDKELVATIGWAKQIPGETFTSIIWGLCVQKRLAC